MNKHTQHVESHVNGTEPRHDDGDAFIPDPGDGPIRDDRSVESELLEDFLRAATTGQDVGDELSDQIVSEEFGGPFVTTSAGEELADDVDESNPRGAKREPWPTPMRGGH